MQFPETHFNIYGRYAANPVTEEEIPNLIALAESGDTDAMNRLASTYKKGDTSLGEDKSKALDLYKKAAARKHPRACYNLAIMRMIDKEEDFTADDFTFCHSLFDISIQSGRFPPASYGMYYLISLYPELAKHHSQLIPATARRYLHSAADAGFIPAMIVYGWTLIAEAADEGYPEAKRFIAGIDNMFTEDTTKVIRTIAYPQKG